MIKGFKHKGLKRFFTDPRYSDIRGVNASMINRLKVILDALDVIETPEEMDIAGLDYHPLKGDRKGTHSVKVSGNWRVTWRMDDSNANDVNLEDYH